MMLVMGLYLLPTHTHLVYEQSRFFTDGRGGARGGGGTPIH